MTLGKIKHDVSSVIRLSSLQEAPSPQHLGERWMVWAYMLFWGDDFGPIFCLGKMRKPRKPESTVIIEWKNITPIPATDIILIPRPQAPPQAPVNAAITNGQVGSWSKRKWWRVLLSKWIKVTFLGAPEINESKTDCTSFGESTKLGESRCILRLFIWIFAQ